jgi:CubicO group peptidase (beta-lactamase class C family)
MVCSGYGRRKFLQVMGMTSASVVLGDCTRRVSAQVSSTTSAQQILQAEAWIARHGLTGTDYQGAFDQYTNQGYRPIVVTGYVDNSQPKYAAIFAKVSNSPAWIARHGLTATDYQRTFDLYIAQGYRPVQVTGYGIGNQAYYTAIFEKTPNAPAWVARHGILGAEYQREFDNYVAQGYRPIDISAYAVNNQVYYAAIFEKTPNAPVWVARHGISGAEYQREFDNYAAQGYRLVKASGCSVGNQDQYTAIWEKSEGANWVARHGISAQSYQTEFDYYSNQGYRLVWVNVYPINNQVLYATIWNKAERNGNTAPNLQAIDQLIEQFMQQYSVPGLSFAIAKNENLVLAKSYGVADPSTGEKVTPQHRFRIASLSKPITAIAIMNLVEAGQLRLNDRVLGSNGILGTDYGTPRDPRIENITIEHLLTHVGGGWSNDNNDPMFAHPEKSQAELISWTLDQVPLTHEPGASCAYSNFGYCLLGRVIEKVTGQSYETFVKAKVLNPCGITGMEIGGDTRAERKENEVTYVAQGGEFDPYAIKLARMDAHGGWIGTPTDLVKLLVHVDGGRTQPDILTTTTLQTMYTPGAVQPRDANGWGYAKGWVVNTASTHWHNGNLPGERSIMVSTSDQFCWAVLINTRRPNSDIERKLDDLMWAVKKKIND